MSNEHANTDTKIPLGGGPRSAVLTGVAILGMLGAFALAAYLMYRGEPEATLAARSG